MDKLILPAIVSALLFACASAPAPSTPEAAEKPTSGAAALKASSVKIVRIPVEKKAYFRFADGSLDEYTQSEYDPSLTFIQTQTRFSASGAQLEKIEFSYRDGLLVTKTVKDSQGLVSSRRLYSYGSGGRLVSETLEDRAGKIISSFEYDYDAAGHKTKWIVKDSGGTTIAETTYSYTGGKVLSAELRDGIGKKSGSSSYEYDAEGRIVAQRFKDALGSLLRVETSVWKDGRLMKEERASAGGVVQQRSSYEYGADGEILRKTMEDNVGKSKQIVEFEYAIREDRKTVEE